MAAQRLPSAPIRTRSRVWPAISLHPGWNSGLILDTDPAQVPLAPIMRGPSRTTSLSTGSSSASSPRLHGGISRPGRHWARVARPGSTSLNPSKNQAISARLREMSVVLQCRSRVSWKTTRPLAGESRWSCGSAVMTSAVRGTGSIQRLRGSSIRYDFRPMACEACPDDHYLQSYPYWEWAGEQ